MKLIITESQFKNLLSEELGISEFVYGESCKLFSILEKSIAGNTKNSIKNEFYGEIKGDVVFPFMNANIQMICQIIKYILQKKLNVSRPSIFLLPIIKV